MKKPHIKNIWGPFETDQRKQHVHLEGLQPSVSQNT